MRALVYFSKGDIRFTDTLAEPEISTGDELLVDIVYCGICGTDLHELTDGPIFFPLDNERNEISGNGLPQAMGHEMAGIVTAVGSGVKKFQVGDHVAIEPTGTCRDRYRWPDAPDAKKPVCTSCQRGMYNCCDYLGLIGNGVQSGGFAERIVVNESHCYKCPDNLPWEVAALIQPIAVCWHAINIAQFKPGSSVLILGGGPIGLGTILALNGHGCTEIIVSEPVKLRRDYAEKMGAVVYDPLQCSHEQSIPNLRKMAPGADGFDYCFDCSGTPATLKASIECLTFRGTAVNVAMWATNKAVNFYPMDITKQEKIYTGSMCYTYHDFEEVIEAFGDGSIDAEKARHMITSKVRLEQGYEDALLKLLTHKEETIKILITPNNHHELDS
ncbi:putative dehydrogenase BDH2 KNAG_0E04200 [Huiozyma naganishii CBS 8797]|uniref:Enoyl reductase (ER) domain-containing protein n=1 Tax=Huiozyma naganishii (strain ATCC MYA-139 / BCRC 22969 / CBS 8797 / KCTC 17520 / NBRC 10181 / NCYC 3082 / Yp74L-3) TaxID=1071383 RepID=J7RMA3_HUIN7|nr:hypothetical protein KNAG_0E04200 [Kazachstania naganishii CBS 8797]CCK70673.1 hypothetical protein KNAG_0E04200 [Kazachstania naganishii CBS 8797]